MLMTFKCQPRTAVPTAPRVGLMDPNFVYVSAANTNIRETFKRIRSQQQGSK